MRSLCRLTFIGLVALAACKSGDSLPTSRPLGVVNVLTQFSGADTVTSPVGVFWNASNITLPDSKTVVDSCTVLPFSTATTPPASLDFLDAGDPITVATNEDNGTMSKVIDPVYHTASYKLNGPPLKFSPGANVTFQIPGAPDGFTSFTLTGPTAKPLTLAPVPASVPANQRLTIDWDGNGSPNSSVVVQLEYAASGSTINSQIFCSFADDGTHDIPANLASRWSDANANGRPQHVHAYRWITTYVTQGTPLMVLIGQYDTDQNVPAAGSRQR